VRSRAALAALGLLLLVSPVQPVKADAQPPCCNSALASGNLHATVALQDSVKAGAVSCIIKGHPIVDKAKDYHTHRNARICDFIRYNCEAKFLGFLLVGEINHTQCFSNIRSGAFTKFGQFVTCIARLLTCIPCDDMRINKHSWKPTGVLKKNAVLDMKKIGIKVGR